jgi:hypothetical protein
MMKLRCKKPCRERGRVTSCERRTCCLEKNFKGCWECEEFEVCEKSSWLKDIHEDAHLKNLRRLKKLGMDGFLKGRRNW